VFNRPSSLWENPIPRNLFHQADISERNRLLIKLKITESLCEGSCLIIQQILLSSHSVCRSYHSDYLLSSVKWVLLAPTWRWRKEGSENLGDLFISRRIRIKLMSVLTKFIFETPLLLFHHSDPSICWERFFPSPNISFLRGSLISVALGFSLRR